MSVHNKCSVRETSLLPGSIYQLKSASAKLLGLQLHCKVIIHESGQGESYFVYKAVIKYKEILQRRVAENLFHSVSCRTR